MTVSTPPPARRSILSFLSNGYNRLDMSHLILTNFLDSIGEAINANQGLGLNRPLKSFIHLFLI